MFPNRLHVSTKIFANNQESAKRHYKMTDYKEINKIMYMFYQINNIITLCGTICFLKKYISSSQTASDSDILCTQQNHIHEFTHF